MPVRVACGGGNNFYHDDQQTPDTQVVTFDFPRTCLVWEHRIWSRTGIEGGERLPEVKHRLFDLGPGELGRLAPQDGLERAARQRAL